jgi:ribosomal protein S18
MKIVKRKTLKEIRTSSESDDSKTKADPDKKIRFLKNFISRTGKLLPRRKTGLSSREHKQITKLIKRSRSSKILPFVISKA